MLNHVIVFSNKFLRLIFNIPREYKIRYSILEYNKNPVLIWVNRRFEFKIEIEK